MSNLVEHAKRELELLGETDEEYINGILQVVNAFAAFGHSGGSASVAIPTIHELLQFHTLTPLTNNPEEWNEVAEGVWQNSRNPEAFSGDEGVTYYLLSEMTPLYESEQYVAEETDASGEAGAVAPPPESSASVNPGDTAVPVNVTSDQPPTAQ
jgi:hypothetical protein